MLCPTRVFIWFSDSKINIDNYEQGAKHCKSQPNGDLWHQLFDLLQIKQCTLSLEFVPSHIFDKKHKLDVVTSEYAILSNCAADSIAGYAASRLECPPSESTSVISKLHLVKAIQLRLFAIVSSFVPRKVETSVLKPKALTIDEEIARSAHVIVPHPTRVICVNCCASISLSCRTVAFSFVQSPCIPRPRDLPRPVPLGISKVQLGNQVAHASHVLFVYRGLTFCNKCGCRAIVKYHNLAKACVAPTTYGTQTKHAIKLGKLPPGFTCWPDSA